MLPSLPYCPSSLANDAAVRAALAANAQAMAALDWQVPGLDQLAVLRIGLPTCAFAAQLQAALGVAAVLSAPCGGGLRRRRDDAGAGLTHHFCGQPPGTGAPSEPSLACGRYCTSTPRQMNLYFSFTVSPSSQSRPIISTSVKSIRR